MNNTRTTSPSQTPQEQDTRKPAYNGLFLVRRSDRPAAGSAPSTSSQSTPHHGTPHNGITLATSRSDQTSLPAQAAEAHSAESIRMKLAACFGAILTAPVVWCLHTLLLSHTR